MDHLEDEVKINTEYNGTDEDGWPYFKLAGTAYWSIVVIVVSVGLIGNILSCILVRDHRFSVFSYPVYIKCLAATGSVLLIIKLLEASEFWFDLSPFVDYNTAICKIWLYISYISSFLLPWLLVGLSVDRVICVYFPLTRKKLCSRKNAIIVCLLLAILSALVMLPIVSSVHVLNYECTRLASVYYLFITFDLVLCSTLPCLVTFVLNICIIVHIRHRSSFRGSFTSTSRFVKHDKSTRPLLMVSNFALLTLLPLSVSQCIRFLLDNTGVDKRASILSRELQPLFNLVYMLNFGQYFYTLILSSKYRQVMTQIMRCRKWSIQQDIRSPLQGHVTDSVRSSVYIVESIESGVTITPNTDAVVDLDPQAQTSFSVEDGVQRISE